MFDALLFHAHKPRFTLLFICHAGHHWVRSWDYDPPGSELMQQRCPDCGGYGRWFGNPSKYLGA